jgi:serine-type D-Ala-D-Ala carboxypeptidase
MKKAERLIQRAIGRGDFPAATLLAARDGQPHYHGSFGRAQLASVYDLASLTKVLATTAVLMRLVDEKKLGVAERVETHLPSLKRRKIGKIRLSQLLTHSSGLVAWRPFYEELRELPQNARRKKLHQRLADENLISKPGQDVVYSDLGLLLLQWVIERRMSAPLDHLAQRLVYQPLGLDHTFFRPLWRTTNRKDPTTEMSFVPTEYCTWRKRRLCGEVHDDNSFSLGGVTGHAGLFSTAHDIHLLCREFYAAYRGQRSIFSPKTVRRFFDWQQPNCHRALGWDRPSLPNLQPNAGRYFSENTVGHLGFTGTSLWVDLDKGIWVIFLANRVYRGREPNPMPKFRPQLHNAVMRSLLG